MALTLLGFALLFLCFAWLCFVSIVSGITIFSILSIVSILSILTIVSIVSIVTILSNVTLVSISPIRLRLRGSNLILCKGMVICSV